MIVRENCGLLGRVHLDVRLPAPVSDTFSNSRETLLSDREKFRGTDSDNWADREKVAFGSIIEHL